MFGLSDKRGEGRDTVLRWLRLVEVEPDVYLVHEGNDDDFLVMHRPHATPAWIAESRRPCSDHPELPPRPPAEASTPAR